MDFLGLLLLLAVVFAPTVIAVFRRHRNAVPICLTQVVGTGFPIVLSVFSTGNLAIVIFLVGLICWIFALIWALSNRNLALAVLEGVKVFLGAMAKFIGGLLIIAGVICVLIGGWHLLKGAWGIYTNFNPALWESFVTFLRGASFVVISALVGSFGLFLLDLFDKNKTSSAE